MPRHVPRNHPQTALKVWARRYATSARLMSRENVVTGTLRLQPSPVHGERLKSLSSARLKSSQNAVTSDAATSPRLGEEALFY